MTPLRFLIISLITVQSLFAALPALDLGTSALFYRPVGGFWLAQNHLLGALRAAGWNLGLGVLAALAAMTLASWRMRLRTPVGVWGFGLTALLIGPGVLVNGVFKEYWGRARPYQIVEFGGPAQFTPPLHISSECLRNCSFVSGEGALAITVALVLWRLGAPFLGAAGRTGLGTALVAYALLVSGLRIAFGGHFLSDTLFAGLICGFVCCGLSRLSCFRNARASPRDVLADLKTVATLPLAAVKSRSSLRAGSALPSDRATPAARRYWTWTGFRFPHP